MSDKYAATFWYEAQAIYCRACGTEFIVNAEGRYDRHATTLAHRRAVKRYEAHETARLERERPERELAERIVAFVDAWTA